MESPLSFIVEHFMKRFLQDYIQKESLVLDSFSLFDTSINLKNIELKEQTISKNGINIHILFGSIYELIIEGSIFEKKVACDVSNVSITIFIENLDNIIFTKSNKQPIITKDPTKQYSFEKNQYNTLYTILNQLSILKLRLSNIKINIYTIIEGVLLHLTLFLGEISTKPNNNTKTFNQADFASMIFKVSKMDLSINFGKANNQTGIPQQISQGKEDIYQTCSIIQNTTAEIELTAGKLRFERDEKKYSNDKVHYHHYNNFPTYERNNELMIDLKENNILISDTFITNCMILFKKIKNKQMIKKTYCQSGMKKFQRIVNNIKNYNQTKSRGYKFCTPQSDKAKKYLTIIKYLTYIGLILKQRKIIHFDISFYLCEKLVNEYKNNILGDDHFLIDYLITENIAQFLESPPISGGSSIFLNMQLFSSLKASTKNNTLKGFMLFILQKFMICKECIKNYKSYDDFFFITFKVEKVNISLIRSLGNITSIPKTTTTTTGGNMGNTMNSTNKAYLNKLENTVRCLRSDQTDETSNVLLKFELINNDFFLYTNLKEHYLLKNTTLKLYIYDISYRKLSLDNHETNKMIPIFKIEYQAEVSVYIINSSIHHIGIDIPSIIVLIDPFYVYFCILYFKSIINSLNNTKFQNNLSVFQTITEEKIKEKKMSLADNGSNIDNKPNISMQTSTRINKEFLVKDLQLRINVIMITFAHSDDNKHNEDNESIALQLTKIDFSMQKNKAMLIKLSVGELLLGTISIFNLKKFLAYEQTLWFETNIFSMFDINQIIELSAMQKEGLVTTLNTIIIELQQKDLYNFYKLYLEFISLFKFLPVFEAPTAAQMIELANNNIANGIVNLEQNDSLIDNDESQKTSLFFALVIEKIIINIVLNETIIGSFRHIIAILQDTSLIKMKAGDIEISSIGFKAITCYERQEGNILNELFSSKCENPIDMTLLSKDNFYGIYQVITKQDENGYPLDNPNNQYEGYVLLTECRNVKRIISSLPHCFASFDYNLLACVTEFLNFKGATSEFVQIAENLLKEIKEDFPSKYHQLKEKENKMDRHQSINDINASVRISSAKVLLYEKREVFLEFTLDQLIVKYINQAVVIDIIIKTICDMRPISYKKKTILSKKSSSGPLGCTMVGVDKESSALKASITFKPSEKALHICIDNAKVIFLMRVTMDIVEYFYKIIFLDILEHTNYDELYDSTKTLKHRVENINEQNQKSKVIIKHHNRKYTNRSILNKSSKTAGKYKNNLSQSNNSFIQQEKKQKKMKISITIRNFDVALCMNSLKDDELILSSSEFEFSTVFDKDREEIVLSYFNNKKANQQMSFNMAKVDFYAKLKDCKIRKIIERNTTHMKSSEISIVNMIKDTQIISDSIDQTTGSFMLLIEANQWEKILSTMKILVIIPYMKVKLYNDIYEEMLRLIYENLNEARTIISQSTIRSKKYYDAQVHDYDDVYKRFTIVNDIIVFNEECIVNIYNYPSKCTLHKIDKTSLQHSPNMNCQFGHKNPSIEIDKMCHITLTNLYNLMRFYNSGEKNIFLSISDIGIELNSKMTPYKDYTSHTLIRKIDKERRKGTMKTPICNTKTKTRKTLEINDQQQNNNNNNNSNSELSEWVLTMDMTQKKMQPMIVNMFLTKLQINFCQISLMALNNFFGRYFNYYKNKKVKNVDHNNPISKRIVMNMTNSEILFKPNRSANQSNLYEIKIDFDMKFVMNNDGNTCTGPFTSYKEISLEIKDGFINSLKGKDNEMNPFGLKFYSIQNQFLDNFKLNYSTYAKCDQKWQDKDRYSYTFLKYGDSRFTPFDVNVINDDPFAYRDYIRLFKFKEDEEIPINVSFTDSKNNNNINHDEILLNNNNNNTYKLNDENQSGNIILHNEEDDEHSILTTQQQITFPKKTSNGGNGIIRISLSLCQLFRLQTICEDLNKNYTENAKYILGVSTVTKFSSEITYKTYMACYFSDIEMRICDSQFNAQLFQIVISKLMGMENNTPNSAKLIEGLTKLMKKYEYSRAEPLNIEDKEFIDDTLIKFLLKINYYNSNQSKKKNDAYDMLMPQMNNQSTEVNDLAYWEPFIEPLPAKFTYLISEKSKYVKLDILSLMPSYSGISGMCRQKKFHSLNINFNERLMEIFNLLLKDYQRTKEVSENKEEANPKATIDKTLTVKNLTEYSMIIDTNDNLEEKGSSGYQSRVNNPEENDIHSSTSRDKIEHSIEIINDEPRSITPTQTLFLEQEDNEEEDDEEQVKNTFYFQYHPCKRINDKDEIYVCFSAPISQTQAPEREGVSVIDFKKRKNIYPSINGSKNHYGPNSQLPHKRGRKTYNIERPCKYFNIHRNKKNQLNLNIAEERDELRKNFDNKASILLKGEHFIVCEIEINQEGNKKLVTFRSNEGIKNELDFPIKIIFIVKEKARKSDLKIVLLPGQFYFIPPMMLDNIKEIQLKPVAYGNKLIHFGCDSFPYNETSLRQHEDNNEKIYIARCPIKEVRTYSETQKKVPFNDHIVFCIVKKSEKIDNEFLDDEIKNKIDFIRSYQNYNYDRSNKTDNRQNDISKIISDTTYILTPIMRFHNYLPRELTIEKRIPSDFQNKKVKESSCAINNYFDIENFFKMEKEGRKELMLNQPGCKQNQYADNQECNYENYKMQRDKDCFFDYTTKTIIKTGEYMSIYEPFILSEKGQNYLHFYIEVNEDDHISLNSNHRRLGGLLSRKEKKELLTFDIKPFFFPTIIKAIKQTEIGNNLIEFPKILKENINKCASEHSKNYFLNTLEVTENRVLNSYLFCPFLFLNSSDMNLEIRYQRYVKRLPGHKKTAIDYTTNTSNAAIFHKFDLNRMVMFCPTSDGRFAFELGHVTLQSDILTVNTNNTNGPIRDENIKKEELQSQWEKIKIFNISKYGGITVDLTSKTKKPPRASSIKQTETIQLTNPDNLPESQSGVLMNKNQKKSNSVPVEEKDKKLTFSLQMQLLPKYSTLILITSAIHIGNHTQKDIYVYHLPMNKTLPIKSFVLKAMTSTKFHYLINYYSYVQLSFEDKYIYNDKRNFSGLINFSHDELKNKEFFIALGDPKKEPLIAVKIYEEKGSKFVLLTQREEVNQYPYVIINKLNIPITYKQKENLDDESNEINVIYKHLEKDFGIVKRIVPLFLKEYSESAHPNHNNNMNVSNRYPNSYSDNLPNNIAENKTYYTWEEPLLYDKEKNCNIVEIILFGSKFDIDPQEIQKDVSFSARVNNNKDNYIENINDESISKGKIRITEKKHEYQYELYKHTLILKSTTEGEDPIIFELHDNNLTCERNYNGNFTMKNDTKEFEMFCVSIDETNNLVEKIFAFSRKAKEFSDEFVIKKVAKNKCIFIEITKKKDIKQIFEKIQQTHFYLNIENVGLAFMYNHNEFMYIWLRSFYSYIQKEYYANEKDNNILFKEIVFKLKDYQIDNYSKHTHYPVILSPLSDKSYDPNYKDYCNFLLVINNLQMGTELYQVEFIYANFTPIDLRFENKFLENISAFYNKVMVCFNNCKTTKEKSLNDFEIEIDSHKFIESNKHMASETRIHVKKFCIDDIKICFSLKFDNIDLFLQTRSFLFMKPLIEELGLRILNLDSTIFAIPNYTKNNISQSTDDFINMVISFLCQQFFSELVKALGGISSITSMQIVENFNNNILSNMKGKDNRMDRYKTRKGFKEFYRAGYENVSTVVGGIFILVYKMMATAGKIFATLTFDEKYMKRRSYIINKSIKSLSNGLTISIQVLMCALFYMFAQFYYIPHVYFKSLHWILALLLTTLIIIIGIVWKPICGIFDCLTKSLETIGVSINDILADRVKIYARFPRKIKENNLHIYNSLEALALFAQGCIDMQHDKKKTEDVCMAIPGLMNKGHIILLMTLDRLMIVRYKGEFFFKEKLLIHFSTFELFSVDLDENIDINHGNEAIRKSIHDTEVANKIQHAKDKKYDTVQFEKKGNERIIHVFMNRRGCLDFYGKTFEIKLIKMNNRNNLTANYDTFVNTIVSKKK